MKADTLLRRTTATLGAAVLSFAVAACASHRAVDTTSQTTGQIRTEQASQQQASSGETLATVPAPANTQGVTASSTPAVISGPAAVDKSGNVYSSSSVGSAGNASGTGLNTNVNLQAPRSTSSTTVTQSPATTVETTPAPAPIVTETPAPAPVVTETPAPAPVVTETQTTTTTTETVPMTSAQTTETTTTTTKHHKRMRKD